MRAIKLSSDRKSARVVGRMRTRFEVKDMDPEYRVLRAGEWYLGDKEKLKAFK